MNVLWFKVWHDLWHNRLRTMLVVLSIAVGVFAVGTTFGMVEQMLPAMDAAHRSSSPSHVTMYTTRPVDREVILSLRREPGVVDVEPLNVVEVRYKKRPEDPWRKGNILMRDDYLHQTYDVVQLKGGQWPQDGGLGIERMHSPFYGLDIGDRVILEVDDKERYFAITGKIRHPFVPPPQMYDLAYFFSDEEVMQKFDIPVGRFTQFKFNVEPYSDENARRVATAVKERLARQGISIFVTMYQDPDKHWGRAFVDGMSLVNQVLAVVSSLLSVVLVLNTLTAIITQQTNQIGVMKALGGSSYVVARVYLAGVVFYGALALAVSLPLGMYASYSMTRWFLALYNIEYAKYISSGQAITFQVIASLIVPMIAALWPVMQGAGMTVRQAISSYGLGGDFKSGWFDHALERFGQRFLKSYDAIALVNTFRRKGRLILTQFVLVTAGAMFLMIMSLSSSMKATLDADFGRRSHDLVISLRGLERLDRLIPLVEGLPEYQSAQMWQVEPVTILHQGQKALDAGLGSQLQGVSVDDPTYLPLVVEGRWLKPGDGHAVVMNRETAEKENIALGDVITLDMGVYGKDDWQVVGLYQVFSMFGGGFNVDAIYAPRGAVYQASNKHGKGNILLASTHDHSFDGVRRAADHLEGVLKRNNIEIGQIEMMPQTRKTFDASFSMVIGMLMALAVLTAIVGGIGLMGSLWISVIERTKEIGVMRAIGARSTVILRMFMLEGILQACISWLIATPLSILIAPLMSNALGMAMFNSQLDYSYNYPAVAIWLVIVLVIAMVASIIPAYNATQVNVRQSLVYE